MSVRQERSAEELGNRAGQAKLAADNLARQIEENPALLQPSSTDDGERVPSPAPVGLGALRQAAQRWEEQAELTEKQVNRMEGQTEEG